MRMKNRFHKMGKSLLGAMCLLSIGSLTYSCSDDYDLDETMPAELGGSIYSELKARNYTTVIRLIEDLGYKDVLSKTGSKTIFAASDDAYQAFYGTSGWVGIDGNPVTSYEQLTTAQKKLLLNSCMLNNAYVMEMLSNTSGGGKNLCLRQTSSAAVLDSVRFWNWSDLPENLNVGEVDAEGNNTGDKRFWDPYRKQARGGMYMVMDKTVPMMTHFLEGQMKEKNIKHSDIGFIVGDNNYPETENRSYIYGSRVLQQDIVCLHGYIHTVDKVILTPDNMAEMIRKNGTEEAFQANPKTSTRYFSALLERFSAPYYDYNLTEEYRKLFDIGNDSVFQKRYIADRSQSGKVTTGPDKKSLGVFPTLTYDPGWNQYAISASTTAENDMAAMFIPNDEAMEEYFLHGGGQGLMDRYAKDKPVTKDNLYFNIQQIPLDIVQPLLNNMMKDSFNESVPSKYKTIMNDAQDQMFDVSNPLYADETAFKQRIQKVMLANNGVVYIMDKVSTPADYASVLAPALYSVNTQIVKAVVRADDNYIEGSSYMQAPLKKYYSTYLKAMQSRFSFFVPTDEGLKKYGLVDPMSVASNNAENFKYWCYEYKNQSGAVIPVRCDAKKYDITVGQQEGDPSATVGGSSANKSEANGDLSSNSGLVKKTMLIDMIDQHIIVHNQNDTEGINGAAQYYISRAGAPVFVVSKGEKNNVNSPNKNMKVMGGFQKQIEDQYGRTELCTVTEGYNLTTERNGYGNGMTYLLDRPMQPTTRSVYNVFYNDPAHYQKFFDLCMSSFSEEDLKTCGLKKPGMSATEWAAEQNKYRIFTVGGGYNAATNEQLIRFFNNYRYTVYVPTNDAMDAAYAKGLPTYEQIASFIEANRYPDPENEGEYTMNADDQAKAVAMMTMLINFGKYHFQDQSFYVDNASAAGKYQTACIDNVENIYIDLNMKQGPAGQFTVTGKDNVTAKVIAPYNVMARDANFDRSSSPNSISNSSFVVIHQIDKVLNFKPLTNGRYDSEWTSATRAKAFVKKYGLKK